MTFATELTDLEKEIFAEADKLRAKALEEALKIRKSNLLKEVEDIEEKLAALLKVVEAVEPKKAAEPAKPAPKAAPKKAA